MSADPAAEVTAAITTCRRPVPLVERALQSVMNQTYPAIRVFVVNDYPEDEELSAGLEDMCRRYDVRFPVTYLTTGHNSGACRARNVALEASDSPYIAFLDDDDEWLPDKIARQVAALEAEPKAAMAYCNVWYRYSDGTEKIYNSEPMPSGNIFHRLMKNNMVGSCSFPLLRTEPFKEVGGFSEDMPALQDLDAWLKLMQHHEAVYIDEPLAIYHVEPIQRISRSTAKRANACEKLEARFRDVIRDDRKDKAAMALRCLYLYSNDRRKGASFNAWCRAVAARPQDVGVNLKKFNQVVKAWLPRQKA